MDKDPFEQIRPLGFEGTPSDWVSLVDTRFSPLNSFELRNMNRVAVLAGPPSIGKTTIAKKLTRHLPIATSRPKREGEVNGLVLPRMNDGDMIFLSKEQFEDPVFTRKNLIFFFQAPVNGHYYGFHKAAFHEAIAQADAEDAYWICTGVGLDTLSYLLCRLSFENSRSPVVGMPTTIFMIPSDPSVLAQWYAKRGSEMDILSQKIDYHLAQAESLLHMADYVVVLNDENRDELTSAVSTILKALFVKRKVLGIL
ncbi:MAG: hypothetical protein WCW17_02680 [Patescibacteria group bacterium]